MSELSKNLAPQRGPSVWERPSPPQGWTTEDSERWMVTICGGTLALIGLRQRSTSGVLLAALGATCAARALLGYHDVATLRDMVGRLRESVDSVVDEVDDASAGSFPASDAPSWTSTAGVRGASM